MTINQLPHITKKPPSIRLSQIPPGKVFTYWKESLWGWDSEPEKSLSQAFEFAKGQYQQTSTIPMLMP